MIDIGTGASDEKMPSLLLRQLYGRQKQKRSIKKK